VINLIRWFSALAVSICYLYIPNVTVAIDLSHDMHIATPTKLITSVPVEKGYMLRELRPAWITYMLTC